MRVKNGKLRIGHSTLVFFLYLCQRNYPWMIRIVNRVNANSEIIQNSNSYGKDS